MGAKLRPRYPKLWPGSHSRGAVTAALRLREPRHGTASESPAPLAIKVQENAWVALRCAGASYRLVGLTPEEFPAVGDGASTGWLAIDEAERAAGEPAGRPRVKLCTWDELLGAAGATAPRS